jgi:hypothetical protein
MNKRRFIDSDNKIDLDLTYICDRLIVMAIPCVDSALYRNDIREVARFFATRHYGLFINRCFPCSLFQLACVYGIVILTPPILAATGRFLVFNLCEVRNHSFFVSWLYGWRLLLSIDS